MQAILEAYRNKEEPGCHKDDEQLREKTLGGDPASAEKAGIRKQCKPTGPIGFYLETLHLQTATMDEDYTLRQWNQPKIELQKGPAQQLGPLMTRMVTRNRTRRAEGGRFQSQGLVERRLRNELEAPGRGQGG